ncbi:MAG: hypothetical protein ACKPKO_56110, partial [Candidatus Fonsibacter sp.]
IGICVAHATLTPKIMVFARENHAPKHVGIDMKSSQTSAQSARHLSCAEVWLLFMSMPTCFGAWFSLANTIILGVRVACATQIPMDIPTNDTLMRSLNQTTH